MGGEVADWVEGWEVWVRELLLSTHGCIISAFAHGVGRPAKRMA